MKKTTMIIALAFAVSSVFAQDLTSKKGEPILPEANDWAIGFDAVPFLNYAGNLFSGSISTNSAPSATWINSSNQTIIGKMFKDEKTAYRAQVRIGFNTAKQEARIGQAGAAAVTFPTPPPMVTDVFKSSNSFIGLGAGMEWRRGKTRLQGFYGGDVLITFSGSKQTYDYGNALSATVAVSSGANTTDFGSNIVSGALISALGNGRVTEQKNGSTLGFGVRGFIGAEYFVLPKISVGAEYGWGLGISKTGETEQTIEAQGGIGPGQGSATIVTVSKAGSFGLDTDLNGWGSATGSLFIMFHF